MDKEHRKIIKQCKKHPLYFVREILGVDNLTKGVRAPLCLRSQPCFGSMVMVDNEELTADPGDNFNRVFFELPASLFRIIGDSVLHINNLLHSDRALQGTEFSEVASANRLTLGREASRLICDGWLD